MSEQHNESHIPYHQRNKDPFSPGETEERRQSKLKIVAIAGLFGISAGATTAYNIDAPIIVTSLWTGLAAEALAWIYLWSKSRSK